MKRSADESAEPSSSSSSSASSLVDSVSEPIQKRAKSKWDQVASSSASVGQSVPATTSLVPPPVPPPVPPFAPAMMGMSHAARLGAQGMQAGAAAGMQSAIQLEVLEKQRAIQQLVEKCRQQQQQQQQRQQQQQPQPPSSMPLLPGSGGVVVVTSSVGTNGEPAVGEKTVHVTVDKLGRIVDEQGNVVELSTGPIRTLRINERPDKEKVEDVKVEKGRPKTLVEKEFFDPRMSSKRSGERKKRRTFHFVEAGSYVQFAQQLEEKNKEKLAHGVVPVAKVFLSEKTEEIPVVDVPVIEWWDAPLLLKSSYGQNDEDLGLNESRITNLIEHPVPLEPPCEGPPAGPIPLMLTRKERRKLRTQARLQRQRELQDKIRMGVIPPPPPRLKLSNMMRVLTAAATKDPTKVEMEVRAQVEARKKKHEELNASRKLTKEQRAQKFQLKMVAGTDVIVKVKVFRVDKITSKLNRIKIDKNAHQFHLTGCAILSDSMNLILVEGSDRALRKFDRLVRHRIDWSNDLMTDDADDIHLNDSDEDDHEEEESRSNNCVLVWDGVTPQRNFVDFRMQSFPTSEIARKYLRDHKYGQIYDIALNSQ